MFCAHAYKLHQRHRPNILIIIEPRIAEARAQGVIGTLPYSHSRCVDPAGFSGGIWLLWKEGPTYLGSSLTTALLCLTLTHRSLNPPNSFALSKCG